MYVYIYGNFQLKIFEIYLPGVFAIPPFSGKPRNPKHRKPKW